MASLFSIFIPDHLAKRIKHIGLKNTLLYAIVQNIFRINPRVPWPVHWSSIVMRHENIKRSEGPPYPGYMIGQYIQAKNGIEIGRNVRMGPGVKLISANHDIQNFDIHTPTDPIIIGDNCWLSADVKILPGVTLGNHVIVAAGAVVTKSFPENSLVGGVPARLIKHLPPYGTSEESEDI